MAVLQNIKKLLRERGNTQTDLCKYLGLNKQAFTDWNAGRSNSYVKFMPQIASFLNVSVSELYGETEAVADVPTVSLKTGRIRVTLREPDEGELLRLYRNSTPRAKAFAREVLEKSIGVDVPAEAKITEGVIHPTVGVKRNSTRGELRSARRGGVRVKVREGKKGGKGWR